MAQSFSRTVEQVAALPLLAAGAGADVLLVTSRRAGRWQLPKGWPIAGRPLAEAAAREAFEEAGVVGPVGAEPIGSYDYRKKTRAGYRVPCRVLVYPLLVEQQLLDWPERTQREMQWLPLAAAAERVASRGLARLLVDLAGNPAPALRVAGANAPAGRAGPDRPA